MRSPLRSSIGLACVVALLAACAPESPSGDAGEGGSGNSNGTGSSNGGTSSDGGSSASFELGGNGEGGSTANTMKCASEAIEAELAPLTMFITFDRSGSMLSDNKWTNATNALKGFFQDPGAADLGVALRFFPEGNCDGGVCDVNACATPNVNVGILTADPAPADTHEAALVQSINSMSPNGGTPMSVALEGGIQWCSEYLAQNPTHKTVVILVTDGEPNGCENSIGVIANIAASGLIDGVPTYTVGLAGSNESQLQQIAMAGGGSAFAVGNGNTQAELLAALQAIRGELLACELPVPQPTEGEFDPNQVNVTYIPGDGGADVTFGKVADEASCGGGDGWYYNDPSNPTTIILCPASCDTVQGDAEGKIEVVLGCETIPA